MLSTLFTTLQQQTLQAALDRVIPPDDFPGAWAAGVGDYLARQLTTGDLQASLALYRDGLDTLNQEAQAEFGGDFARLDAAKQDDVLRRIDLGGTRLAWPVPPIQFFHALVSHAAEGYYADPGQGGNRDRRSWAMVGFDIKDVKPVEIPSGAARDKRETGSGEGENE